MKLDTYLRDHGLDDPQFAALIGRDRTTVYRLRTGKTRPDWQTIAAIARVTGGAVSADDFMPDADPQRPFAAPGGDDEAGSLKPNEAA